MSLTARLSRWTTRSFSALVLALLLAGVPYALATQIGWPLPRELPAGLSDVERILTTPVTDEMVINLLAVAMWIIWGSFALSVVAEIPARLHGVRPPRLPMVAPVQHIAGWLVSGLTAGVMAAATIGPIIDSPPHPPAILDQTRVLSTDNVSSATVRT